MTPEKQIQQAEVMIAHAKGKKVESITRPEYAFARAAWMKNNAPTWRFDLYEFRVADPAQEEWKAGDILRHIPEVNSMRVRYCGPADDPEWFVGEHMRTGIKDQFGRSAFTLDHRPSIDPHHDLREQYEAAKKAGKPLLLQVRWKDRAKYNDDWGDFRDCGGVGPSWDAELAWREKPAPRLVPYTLGDRLEGWVKEKAGARQYLIIARGNGAVNIGGIWVYYAELFRDFTWLNGSPCGKEVSE